MLNFDKENKITFEQLSFSLQDKLRKVITKSELQKLEDLVNIYEHCLNNIRFSMVNSTSEVRNPINNCDVAIVNDGGLFTLYGYSGNRWVKIPAEDVFYTLTIEQQPNQLITVQSGGKSYTSSVNLKYGTRWTASIKSTDEHYKAGTLISDGGRIAENTTVSATPPTVIYNFVMTGVIGKKVNEEAYGIRLNYNGSTSTTEFYGSLDPQIFDAILIRQTGSVYHSAVNFWDSPPMFFAYNKVTLTMLYGNDSYFILNQCPVSKFNATGDLADYPEFTTEFNFNLFKSLKGKTVKFYLHFD